jgi:hypothetical protein
VHSRRFNDVSVKLIAVMHVGRSALVERRVGKGSRVASRGKLLTDTHAKMMGCVTKLLQALRDRRHGQRDGCAWSG